MFYADTIAGTLAWQRVRLMRALDAFTPAPSPGARRQALLSYDNHLDASLWDPMG